MTFMNTFKNLYVWEKKRRGGEGRGGEGGMEAGKDKQWKVK